MIPAKQENEVYSGKGLETTGFRMATNAKAFRILSDGLYEDKITAVIREYACNAYDSHVDAGKKEQPFRVHIPTQLEPYFETQDFGTGLTKDEVKNIYTVYFESTKTQSNEVIGSLGLGSKSAFSVSDQFTVTAIKNHKKVVYSCFINKEGYPDAQLKTEVDTLEEDGVTITIPVDPKSSTDWERKAKRSLSYFEVTPICNVEIQQNPEVLKARSSNSYVDLDGKGCFALMGNVVYRVSDFEKYIKGVLNNGTLSTAISSLTVVLKFEIGEVDVAPSRETLSFDKNTEKVFIHKLNRVLIDYYREWLKELGGDLDNYYLLRKNHRNTPAWDTLRYFDFKFTPSRYNLGRMEDYMNKGWEVLRPLQDRMTQPVKLIASDCYGYSKYYANLKDFNHNQIAADLHKSNTFVVLVGDLTSKFTKPMWAAYNSLGKNILYALNMKDAKLLSELFEAEEVLQLEDFIDQEDKERSSNKTREKLGKSEGMNINVTFLEKSGYPTYKKVDISGKKVAQVVMDKQGIDIGYVLFGKKHYSTLTIRSMIEELGLDGVIYTNMNNQKLVNSLAVPKLEDLITDAVKPYRNKIIKNAILFNRDLVNYERAWVSPWQKRLVPVTKGFKKASKQLNALLDLTTLCPVAYHDLEYLGLHKSKLVESYKCQKQKLRESIQEELKVLSEKLPLGEYLTDADDEEFYRYLKLEKVKL